MQPVGRLCFNGEDAKVKNRAPKIDLDDMCGGTDKSNEY